MNKQEQEKRIAKLKGYASLLNGTVDIAKKAGELAVCVHHKHYRSLGREKNTDLESLCNPCHQEYHERKG